MISLDLPSPPVNRQRHRHHNHHLPYHLPNYQPLSRITTHTMGLIRRALKLTTIGGTATLGAFFFATRNSTFVPLPTTDPIFHTPGYQTLNPHNNPTSHDLCIRRVRLADINPSLLEKKGKLTEAFCAGVWSGWGEFSFLAPARLLPP